MSLTFVSLFAGIGGIDLGLERAGHTCVGQVEINPFCRQVLAKHWPHVPKIADVKDFHGTEFGPFDLLTGGYPCQPFSVAGRRGGDADERHLWPEAHRIIRNVRPRVVLLENVPGHLALGFGRVLGDLAESRYDAEWDCIPAAAVGAPHLRDRLFIVARPQQRRAVADAGSGRGPHHGLRAGRDEPRPRRAAVAHTQVDRRPLSGSGHEGRDDSPAGTKRVRPEPSRGGAGNGEGHVAHADSPRQPVFQGRGAHAELARQRTTRGAGWWSAEPPVGRVADGVPRRVDRLKALGNAVVPQVAEFIGGRLP